MVKKHLKTGRALKGFGEKIEMTQKGMKKVEESKETGRKKRGNQKKSAVAWTPYVWHA